MFLETSQLHGIKKAVIIAEEFKEECLHEFTAGFKCNPKGNR